MNKIQETNKSKIKRAQKEPPGFKFEEFNHQNKYIKFAKVSEIIPIVVKKIIDQDNQEIRI